MSRAWLCHATFTATHLGYAKFNRAIVVGADLSKAGDLTQEQIDVAEGDPETKLPAHLDAPGPVV
jgi:hypothetical protein